MQNIIFASISFVLAAVAFLYGAVKLYKLEKPLYCRSMIAAVGCYLLQELSSLGSYLSGEFDYNFTAGNIGVFCASCIVISAEVCLWEEEGKKAGGPLSLIAPAVLVALSVWCFEVLRQDNGILASVFTYVTLIPMLLASFHCSRHLVLARSGDNNFAATKWCAIFSLLYFALTIVYLIVECYCSQLVINIFYVIVTLSIVLLTLSTVKGEKKWKI